MGAVVAMGDWFDWLLEGIKSIINGLIEKISSFFQSIIDYLSSLWEILWVFLSQQFIAFKDWLWALLPPAMPVIDDFASDAIEIWDIFIPYIRILDYFIHLPVAGIIFGIILLVEASLLIIKIYLFIKRLIPLA